MAQREGTAAIAELTMENERNYRLAVPAKTPGARLGKRAQVVQGRPANTASV